MHLDLGLVLADGREFTSPARMGHCLADRHGVSPGTIWRWHRAFKKQGMVGLADQMRSDKGKSRFFQHHPKAATLVSYLYLEQRQRCIRPFEGIQRDCLSLGIRPQELPSYSTVYDFLTGNAFSEPMKLLAREGRPVYRERCAPYVSRGYSDTAANEIWVSDHMIHDVEVQNDCFLDAEWGTPIRLRFTCLLDFRSRFVVGLLLVLGRLVALHHHRAAPGSLAVRPGGSFLLRQRQGLFEGREERDAGLSARQRHDAAKVVQQELAEMTETGVLARLGMAVQHCIVRHPQSKHVERFFRTVHERLDKKFPTYTGGSPATRPDFAAEAMAEHRKLLRMGLPGMSLHPPAARSFAWQWRGWRTITTPHIAARA